MNNDKNKEINKEQRNKKKNWFKNVGLMDAHQKTNLLQVTLCCILLFILILCIVCTNKDKREKVGLKPNLQSDVTPKIQSVINTNLGSIEMYNKSFNINIKEIGLLKYKRINPVITAFNDISILPNTSKKNIKNYFLISGGTYNPEYAEIIDEYGKNIQNLKEPIFNDKTSLFVNRGYGKILVINTTGKYKNNIAEFDINKNTTKSFNINLIKRNNPKLYFNSGIFIYGGKENNRVISTKIEQIIPNTFSLDKNTLIKIFDIDIPVFPGTLIRELNVNKYKEQENINTYLFGGIDKINLHPTNKIYLLDSEYKLINNIKGEITYFNETPKLLTSNCFICKSTNNKNLYTYIYQNGENVINVTNTKTLKSEKIKIPTHLKTLKLYGAFPYVIFYNDKKIFITKIKDNKIEIIAKLDLNICIINIIENNNYEKESKNLSLILFEGKDDYNLLNKVLMLSLNERI